MKVVLDTSAYCLCETGHESALSLVERALSLHLPTIVYGELYYGFRHGKRFSANLERLEQFIERFAVNVITVDLDVARKFGDIYADLRKRGKPIPTNDLWIAASCMSIGGTLLTADQHFSSLPQIQATVLVP